VFAAAGLAVLAFGSAPAWGSYTAQIVGGTLQVTGNGTSDKLSLRLQAGVPTVLEVDIGDNGTADASFDRSLFTAISVSAGGGNDRVRIDQANGTFTDEAITIDGGPGKDTLLGGDGAEVFLGGPGDDFVDGNRGDDTAFLGEDDDTFHWDPGTTSSRARTGSTPSTSTAPTSPSTSTSRRTAGACDSPATSPTSRWI
jgi:Ca2+-binding RTX toxin-like protein